MTIQEIYNLAIEMGCKADFRDQKEIDRHLKTSKDTFAKLKGAAKESFDQERLTNPFSDTRILTGDLKKEVKKVLVGIDIDGPEVLYAQQQSDIDLIIAHHPRGIALAGLDDVMQLQVDLLHHYGVPVNVAEKLLRKRISEVGRGLSPGNHNRVPDFANLVGQAIMTCHTPTDNLVARFLEKELEKKDIFAVSDVMKVIKGIPEYQEAEKLGIGPKIFVGAEKNRAGKVALTEITGGTEGAPDMYEQLARAGVGTVVGMHMSEKHREEAVKAHINVVIAGHMSSDSLGMNIFLDELEKKGIEIVTCSGLTRVSRV